MLWIVNDYKVKLEKTNTIREDTHNASARHK